MPDLSDTDKGEQELRTHIQDEGRLIEMEISDMALDEILATVERVCKIRISAEQREKISESL